MKLRLINIFIKSLFALAVIFLLPAAAYASLTDGTIDATYKYAWGENIGWINFGAASGNVHVTDTGLTGYAWSANYGWINLKPPTAGVTNDGYGDLSGHAWGENLGWLDFSQVGINIEGEFTGYAIIENTNSRASLNCSNTGSCGSSNFKIKTDWRPINVRLNSVIAPAPTPSASSPAPVALAPETEPPAPTPDAGPLPLVPQTIAPSQSPVSEQISPLNQAVNKLKEMFAPILDKLTELKPLAPLEIPLEKLVPREAPLALKGEWEIMPSDSVDKFVLAPLPNELIKLAEKFPSLNKIFEDINISQITDISKLSNVALTLPGLTQAAGLPNAEVAPGQFAFFQGLPLASLSAQIKQNLPAEIVFAKAGNEKIDYSIDLTINEQGRPQQKITALANQSLDLVVKPDGQVNGVKGYLIFKSAGQEPTSRLDKKIFSRLIKPARAEASENLVGRLQDYLSSLIFAKPGFAIKQEIPVPVEEKLVLKEFDFADNDNDGLWTANIKTPAADGQYEIITVLNYKDPEMGTRAIKLTTVIDPEGYIYEKFGDKEMRIPGAIAYLYWLNPETKQYIIWPSEEYNQANPQVTDVSGKYSFLVPPGSYYLKVEAPGYLNYEGKPFLVAAGGGVHANIELKTKYNWLKNFDWKTILLILVAIFLAYNFYKDRKRKIQ